MRIIKSPEELQLRIKEEKIKRIKTAFVPTMGALHEGHLSLVKLAQQFAANTVVSIFVNPTQFGPDEDLDKYPRTLAEDIQALESLGVQYLFLPENETMYKENHSVYVEETKLSKYLCGASRPGHFRGVTTVVAKLFNIVMPEYAVFGQKDFQQFQIIKKMTEEMNFPIKIIMGDIVREDDGLALSSRNKYLDEEERTQARSLNVSLKEAEKLIKEGEKDSAFIKETIGNIIGENSKAKIDYIEISDRETLKPLEKIDRPAVIALAVFIGKTRLIDNTLV